MFFNLVNYIHIKSKSLRTHNNPISHTSKMTTDNNNAKSRNHYFNLLEDAENNYTFLPVLNHKYTEHYKKQLATFWTVEEVDLSMDRNDFTNKLTDKERDFIKNVLAFFAASDGLVAENLDLNFTQEITFKEIAQCLRFQAMMEDIHSEIYSLMVYNLITDSKERANVLNAINTIPCVKEKADWAKKWTNSATNDIQERLVAWACVEGIQFSGSFCSIMWLGKRNLMPGLQTANQFIRRDEGAHMTTSIMLYNDLKPEYRLSEEKVHAIVREALDIEKKFILDSIPCAMLGMNNSLMTQYLEYVSDRLLVQLGYTKIWNSANPFDFMEDISVENVTNFFERRVTEYNKARVGTTAEDQALTFDGEEDF
jgi:ribonucleoside-diphosphate reductase beta chain